jgi:hypothetical protein
MIMDDVARDAKIQQVRDACRSSDLDRLRELAISQGGLVDDESRRTACRSSTIARFDLDLD